MVKADIKDKVIIPHGIEVHIEPTMITVKGPKAELTRRITSPVIKITKTHDELHLDLKKSSKREKMMLKTLKAHVNNMIKGVQEEFEYKLKICSGHFPITVSFEKGEFVVKNFLGETIPRKKKLNQKVKIEIKGNEITVTGHDKETTGQAAASIEAITRMTDKDRRRFQDGIFIISKAGKKI